MAIAGIGETPFLRRGSKPVKALITDAIELALEDAGLASSAIDGIVTEAAVVPGSMPHDEVAETFGIREYFSGLISQYGAGIGASHLAAAQAIASGNATAVLSYFGVNWGSATGVAYSNVAKTPKAAMERPFGYFGQPVFFATIATRYKHLYNADLERSLGALAVAQRASAMMTDTAQMRLPMSLEQYFAQPYVAEPLRIPDCCLLTDGAVATVTVRSDLAADLRKQPVYVKGAALASVPVSVDNYFTQNPDFVSIPAARPAARSALAMAGCELSDIDFAQLYDCFTISLLMQIEDIGWCLKGEAADFVSDGRTGHGGETPINTNGGLLSHSYMVGASHVTEAVRQLRGEGGKVQVDGAELGLVGLLAGPYYAALVLGAERNGA